MSDYIVVDGQKVRESEFYRTISISHIKEFAYDPQLKLFPDPKIEEVRAKLRGQLDSGSSIDVVVLKEE